MTLVEDLGEVHVTWLEGLGASYRIQGFFVVKLSEAEDLKVEFNAVAFGGNYGGHNVNVKISEPMIAELMKTKKCSAEQVEELLSEVQRRMLNNEMIVEYDKLKPATDDSDPLGNIVP
ncbi:MAG: hypothetical protein ACYCPP_09465 [Nitrososphaerales archaeon]